ncbi:DUF2306 domain-containing protein [Paenibacillus planticolens]|uniref:DUF2306 domain-containing protein n=1 Tax=Paenibacillus planticolens TaxID=2654976 RepID=A0ABX1ZNK5_9BACL|nr:DUF2306 domain-containing protein [Paenibacillus planticolens]NOV01163.1 DUF2306 domain-containing protein [Paenibacillus planticolens]
MFNKKFILPAVYVLAYLLTFYVVLQYVIFSPSQAGMVSAKLGDASFPYLMWKIFFYPHIILGTIALLVGAYQLTDKSRRNPKLHKRLGRIYGFSILVNVLVVPYIALYATGGTPTTIAFMVLDICWLGTTAMGIRSILKRDIKRHRTWMLRSYAITFVFVTFRIVIGIVQLSMDAERSFTFPLSVYLSIALNLVFTEMYVRKQKKKFQIPTEGAM